MSAESDKLQTLFIEHLNRVHCVKAHLVERLVDIADEANFAKVKSIINDTITVTEDQITRLDSLYTLLNTAYSFENCTGLIGFLEDAFSSFQLYINNPELSYVLILSYLHHIECIERASGEILQLLSDKIAGGNISAELEELFTETHQPLIAAITDLYLVKG